MDGEALARNVGLRRHSYAQTRIAVWFSSHPAALNLEPLNDLRMRIGFNRIRIPDVLVVEKPLPEEEDDYLQFGVPNVWVIDPWKHRGWHISATGWTTAAEGIMRSGDGRISMPLVEVLLP